MLLAALVAACSSSMDGATTTATASPFSPSTTATAVPASTTPPKAVDALDRRMFESGRPTRFEPDVVYRQINTLLPLEVVFGLEGWYSDVSGETLVAFLNQTGGASSISANISMLAGVSAVDVEADLRDVATTVSNPVSVQIGGIPGEQFDVDIDFEARTQGPGYPCNDAWDFKSRSDREQGVISQWDRKQLGTLPACGWSRVWILAHEDIVVVVNVSRFDAATEPLTTIEEILPFAEDVAAGLRFCIELEGC